jgi:hypothetical protein
MMEDGYDYSNFRTKVQPVLQSKLEEFRLLGLHSVSEDSLWEFLMKKKWKKAKDDVNLFEIVQDILSVKASDFMSFTTIESYKTIEFSFADENELKELLK